MQHKQTESCVAGTENAEAITIGEALNRLAHQALHPARQSFDAVVKSGKIVKADPDEKGRIQVYWDSVQGYVQAGGFQPRAKRQNTVPPKNAAAAEDAHVECTTEVPAVHEVPQPTVPSIEPGSSASGAMPQAHSAPSVAVQRRGDKSKDSRRKARPEGETVEKVKAGGRRKPPMRAIKNSLRHLNFEETKDIRDWADNRLLHVLSPAAALPQTASSTTINPAEQTK